MQEAEGYEAQNGPLALRDRRHCKASVCATRGFWIVTALFCLQRSFTAYAQLRLPQVAEAFTHFGFPAYFRVELSWAKLLGLLWGLSYFFWRRLQGTPASA